MDFEEQISRMVDEQLISRGISEAKVLSAFRRVKRHHFVPAHHEEDSYGDFPLPIGYGQTISQPYIVALMTQCLKLKGHENVLEIGTGSGYQAAILAEICSKVYTIEREPHLFERAKETLLKEGYTNIEFMCNDGTKGAPLAAPFDAIIVTAAAPYIPGVLKEQLKDRGRLVIPVGPSYSQMLTVVERKGEEFIQEDVCGCVFVPLIGEHGWRVNDDRTNY